MSIVDYLAYSAALNKVEKPKINARVREMIEITGLTKERHKLIGELSKGYRQRVGLAQALIHDPDVLILDEPTTGLDPNQIVEIRSLIKEIGKEKTIMLSSHNVQEVEATCDRIIIINQGKIAADSTTANLKKRASGAERVKVQVASNGAAVGDAILALPGVSAIERDHESKEELWLVDSKPNQSTREQIFRLCVEKGWILLLTNEQHKPRAKATSTSSPMSSTEATATQGGRKRAQRSAPAGKSGEPSSAKRARSRVAGRSRITSTWPRSSAGHTVSRCAKAAG
jgi:ABC-2 type transport system ATP-binding protein